MQLMDIRSGARSQNGTGVIVINKAPPARQAFAVLRTSRIRTRGSFRTDGVLRRKGSRAIPACLHAIIFAIMLSLPNPGVFPQTREPGTDSPDRTASIIRIPVGVVVVHATVTDKKGGPVTDLTRDHFRVFEDGKPQSIQTFALESHNGSRPAETDEGKPVPERAGVLEPDGGRPHLISIMIDDLTSVPDDGFVRVAEAVARFIEEDLGAGDQVGIWSASGKVEYPFSKDKQALLKQATSLVQKLNRTAVERSECPVLTDLQAQKIADGRDPDSLRIAMTEYLKCSDRNLERKSDNAEDAEYLAAKKMNLIAAAEIQSRMAASRQYAESMYRSRNLLTALRRNLRVLGHFDASKSLMLFSDGFLHQDLTFELQDVVEQALRSGVVMNTVDVRGTYNPSFIPADERIVSTDVAFAQKRAEYMADAVAQEEPLNQLANDTGGMFFHGSNDVYKGIRQISGRQEYYYVLTYAIPPQKPDGRFHTIKLEVTRPGTQISYRKGYYAPKEEVTFERQKKEDILEALHAPGNFNEIPIGLSYNFYQEGDASYAVSLLVKIGIRNIRFLEEESRHKNMISVVVVAFDEADQYVKGVEKSVDFRLTDASYANLVDRGVASRIDLSLPLGRYRIKAVVREAAQGKMGSLTKAIEIP